MAIFKFRVINKDQDDFFRDIVIDSDKTFLDFHNIIAESIGFTLKASACFNLCDVKWHKLKKFLLPEEVVVKEDQSELMHESKLTDFIKNPHQKLIYLIDSRNDFTFYIKLLEIVSFGSKNSETRCVASNGVLNKLDQISLSETIVIKKG